MSKIKFCDHCGAKMMEYPHRLAAGHVRVLRAFAQIGGLAQFTDLDLAFGRPLTKELQKRINSDIQNAQKLQYWDMIWHAKKGEPYQLQQRGYDWLTGSFRVPAKVVTYHGKRIRYEGELVLVTDVDPTYMTTEDYLDGARPHP